MEIIKKDFFLSDYVRLKVNDICVQNMKNIHNGFYSPLNGFLRKKDFKSVLENMRLQNGEVWSIPIVLDINEIEQKSIKNEDNIILVDKDEKEIAVLKNIEIYSYDKNEFIFKVFNTKSLNHPGVREVAEMGEYLVGGDVAIIQDEEKLFLKYNYTPREIKEIFKHRGWNTIVAFQTRNMPHRSHEYLQKRALEEVDGLFVHPVIGKKKSGDFRDELILEGYEIFLNKYYPRNRYLLGILSIKMYYAGPREALLHALIRRNCGCTHIIIGRDHAGVGGYYNPYDAHNIFNQFSAEELGIKILKYENVSYCPGCNELNMEKSCNHKNEEREFLSGTKIREMVRMGQSLPKKFIRPEISQLLLNHNNPFVK